MAPPDFKHKIRTTRNYEKHPKITSLFLTITLISGCNHQPINLKPSKFGPPPAAEYKYQKNPLAITPELDILYRLREIATKDTLSDIEKTEGILGVKVFTSPPKWWLEDINEIKNISAEFHIDGRYAFISKNEFSSQNKNYRGTIGLIFEVNPRIKILNLCVKEKDFSSVFGEYTWKGPNWVHAPPHKPGEPPNDPRMQSSITSKINTGTTSPYEATATFTGTGCLTRWILTKFITNTEER